MRINGYAAKEGEHARLYKNKGKGENEIFTITMQ